MEERAIFNDGSMGTIIVTDTFFMNGCWCCVYDNKTFEYHNNIWMER